MIYFDNSATTRVDSDIAQVAAEAMTKNSETLPPFTM